MRLTTSIFIFFVICFTCNAQDNKLSFVDESKNDIGFDKFISGLKIDLQRKDCIKLTSVLDSAIILDYGGGFGKDVFNEIWKPCDQNSPVFTIMHRTLELGGRFSKDKSTFTAPFIYTDFPDLNDEKESVVTVDTVDFFRDSLLTISDGKISMYQILDLIEQNEKATKVIYKSKIGYIPSEKVVSPLGYRIVFRKTNGSWKISEFLAGI